MMQITVIETISSQRAKEIERHSPGITATVELQEDQGRAIVHLATDGRPCGVEFIESVGSVSHPEVDKEYLRYIRDDLYLRILVPSSLSAQLEEDLVTRLRALIDHAREEGYPSTNRLVIYEYDADGVVERLEVALY